MHNLNIVLLIWNVIVLLIYGLDKKRAVSGNRRISESTLLLCSFLMGGVGAMFGMVLFNHKTSKFKFRLCVPLATLIEAGIILGMIKWVLWQIK